MFPKNNIRLKSRTSYKKTGPDKFVDIVGPICETGDFIALKRRFIEVKNDDLLAIRTTGAYSSVMKSNYNSRVDAVEVIIHNGKSFQIKEIDSIQDMISKEKIINFHY